MVKYSGVVYSYTIKAFYKWLLSKAFNLTRTICFDQLGSPMLLYGLCGYFLMSLLLHVDIGIMISPSGAFCKLHLTNAPIWRQPENKFALLLKHTKIEIISNRHLKFLYKI